MKVISYYTPKYVLEADRLIDSCWKFKIDGRVFPAPDRGSWEKNCRAKIAVLIWGALNFHDEALLWVDADGEFLRAPPLDEIPPDADIGVHYHDRDDGFPSTGTIYLAPGPKRYHFLLGWAELGKVQDDEPDGTTFNSALTESGAKLWEMPSDWCHIPDLDMPSESVIITHHQASRRLRHR